VMGRRLIVNADGFGFTEGVNRGILETFACGVVQSTSVLANFPPIEELPELHRRFPEVSVGVHLNLSVGRPVLDASQIPTLVGSDGRFRPDLVRALLRGRIRSAEMKAELTAQIRRILDLGVSPTHIDGHQNKHLYPPFFRPSTVPLHRCTKRALSVRLLRQAPPTGRNTSGGAAVQSVGRGHGAAAGGPVDHARLHRRRSQEFARHVV